jgi:DNA repair photolyase
MRHRLKRRLAAMENCARAGCPVRAVIMPLLPAADREEPYAEFTAELKTALCLEARKVHQTVRRRWRPGRCNCID